MTTTQLQSLGPHSWPTGCREQKWWDTHEDGADGKLNGGLVEATNPQLHPKYQQKGRSDRCTDCSYDREDNRQGNFGPLSWILERHPATCLQERTYWSLPRHYSVMTQVLQYLIRSEEINETLYRHISIYFHFDDTASQIGGKLLSTNSFIAMITAFIQRKTS